MAASTRLVVGTNMSIFHGEPGANALKAALTSLSVRLAGTDGQSPPPCRPAAAATHPCHRRERPVVVDVGANRGQSLGAWAAIYPGAGMVLVEGNPKTAAVLAGVIDAHVAKLTAAAAAVAAAAAAAGASVSSVPSPVPRVLLARALVGNESRVVKFRSSIGGKSSEMSGIYPSDVPEVNHAEFEYFVRWSMCRS